MRFPDNLPAFGKLVDAWREIYLQASPLERAELNKVLGDALAGVADDWGRAWIKDTDRALDLFCAMGWSTGDPGAITHEREPAWLTADMLAGLVGEAESRRPERQWGVANYYADVDAAPFAMLESRAFGAWLCRQGNVLPQALQQHVALSYIYYLEGECCPIHIDDPRTHEFNLLICLDHTRPEGMTGPGSVLRIHAPEETRSFALERGDVLLFRADRMPHARTPLVPGERVALLSAGFKLRAEVRR